ncbi:WD40 repeat-like protein [Gyrodon lividus]|nr:WD40 repeat-like protein [Gyrodon lividus]
MSPNDRLAASGDYNGKIVIRETKEGGPIKHSIQAGRWVWSLCFSPNGEKLAAAVDEYENDRSTHVIRVYDVESGELILGPVQGHENYISYVLWSLDGSQLFSASDDHSIRCWSSETGEPIGQPWTGHTKAVTSISLSPNGTKLASVSVDGTVRFWDAHSGDLIEQPLQHGNSLLAVTFSPSGEFVASGGFDSKVSIWRVPWWDDSQNELARDSFLDLPAVLIPRDLSENQERRENLPSRSITSSQPLVRPINSATPPIITRVQRFWHGLVSQRSSSSPSQQTIELQPMQERRFWQFPARVPVTEVGAAHMTNRVVVGRRERRRKKKQGKTQTQADTVHPKRCTEPVIDDAYPISIIYGRDRSLLIALTAVGLCVQRRYIHFSSRPVHHHQRHSPRTYTELRSI